MRRFLLALGLVACSGEEQAVEDSGAFDSAIEDTAVVDSSTTPDGDAVVPAACIEATGSGTPVDKLVDGTDEATVSVAGEPCKRSFTLKTTAALRDGMPKNPRTVSEKDGPTIDTRNNMFDALYALALEEAREDSVDAISDGSFNDGKPIACAPGGCFETGRLWKYVWTRDTSYSVDLGLAAIDPRRALNSLLFKLSDLRSGGGPQIVQDTGSGGSYPISTDRAVWALGATRLLDFLGGSESGAWWNTAAPAIRNTIEHDRATIFDDGLYRGEQSFLDWREQSYPAWTATDTVHLGMSKALSTNVAHLALLRAGTRLGGADGAKYDGWAKALATSIREKLWLASDKQLATYITTTLDPAPVHRYDALGTALAVLQGVVTGAEAAQVIANYPHLPRGLPVIWPQQKDTKIYHNRAMWPFVTAYFARAAKVVRNDAAVDHAVASLMRGAALNLSNMENFEVVSGKAWLDDGAFAGPVVNSQRQLWSVAGYLSIVHDIIFGMQTQSGPTGASVRFAPYITKKMRNSIFAAADSIVLRGLTGVTVVVNLPPRGASADGGAYEVASVRLDGKDVGTSFVSRKSLLGPNRFEIDLRDSGEKGAPLRVVTDVADYRNIFGPRSPSNPSVDLAGGNVRVTWDAAGESTADVAFNVYRDGIRVASDLSATTWTDATATSTSPSYCYAVEAYFRGSRNHSQHSPPSCYWGVAGARVKVIGASAFTNVGGTGVTNHGKFHYEGWGDPEHTLTAPFTPTSTGEHLLQVTAGNGAGGIDTGITAGLKVVEVLDGTTVVARGHFLMPHLGAWNLWRDSSLVRATLTAGKTYKVVIKHDSSSMNMSFFKHFELYTGGSGGKTGAFSRVNIAELKVLARVN